MNNTPCPNPSTTTRTWAKSAPTRTAPTPSSPPPKHPVPCRIDVPALSTQEETEDAIREAGELFALIRRDEWSLRLALAGEFLALMARIGARGHAAEQDLAEMAPAAVARECWMVEIQFGEPGEGAWIEYDEGQRLYCLKPGFGITVGPDGGVLGVSVIEAF